MMDAVMGTSRDRRVDFLVAGCGIAGLRAAIELAAAASVLVLAKDDPSDSITQYARGGISLAVTGEPDVGVHQRDTLESGDGLCRPEAVQALVEDGPRQIKRLAEWGARFETRSKVTHSQAGGAARRLRVLRAVAGPMGMEILGALMTKAKTLPSLRIKRHSIVTELLLEDGQVVGAAYLDEESRSIRAVHANAVLLATGGLGQVYSETTNPPGACGDGVALAFRAGAVLSDLEFVQFHPTALCAKKEPRLLLPVALREKGALLRNLQLERFMHRYHEAGELAPQDVLSRSIATEMQRGRSEFVYLDLTGLDADHVKRDFPHLYAACLENNIDITSDLVPTNPAAHFAVGGVATDTQGLTSLGGLYAAGEAASTGVHGASRMENNSLLEGLVFGARAARAMLHHAPPASFPPPPPLSPPHGAARSSPSIGFHDHAAAVGEMRRLMWERVGILREGKKMKEALSCLDSLGFPYPDGPSRPSIEMENLHQVARLIALSADARKESRGAHYRSDYPLRNDSQPAKHSFVSKNSAVYFK